MSASSIGSAVGGVAGFALGGPAGAAIGAGIGSGIGGGMDQQRYYNKSASIAAQQSRIAEKQLDFNKEVYNDWKEVFGPIEDNLSEYYQKLDPETYAAQIRDNLSAQFSKVSDTLNKTIKNKDLEDTGLAIAAQRDLNQNLAQQKALVNSQATDIVNNKKLNFLTLGMGQQPALQAGVNSGFNALANSYGNNAMFNMNMGNIAGQAANSSLAGGFSLLGNYLGHQQASVPTMPTVPAIPGVSSGLFNIGTNFIK